MNSMLLQGQAYKVGGVLLRKSELELLGGNPALTCSSPTAPDRGPRSISAHS